MTNSFDNTDDELCLKDDVKDDGSRTNIMESEGVERIKNHSNFRKPEMIPCSL